MKHDIVRISLLFCAPTVYLPSHGIGIFILVNGFARPSTSTYGGLWRSATIFPEGYVDKETRQDSGDWHK